MNQLTDTDMKIINEEVYRSVMETSRPYPDEEIMYFLENYNWTLEKISEHTGYTIEYVREVNELYEYLQSKKPKKEDNK